jgi:hypothetical protein
MGNVKREKYDGESLAHYKQVTDMTNTLAYLDI